jgi:pimeloyl-ACP methyl ester carboxylesterase
VLDTLLAVEGFHRFWAIALAAPPLVGRAWVVATRPPFARWLFYWTGIADRSATPPAEVDAHFTLLRGDDGGRAYQRIVRGFELTAEKERFYLDGVREAGWPARILWGDRDPALGEDERRPIEDALGVEATIIPAKHFLQEDQASAVTNTIADLAASP